MTEESISGCRLIFNAGRAFIMEFKMKWSVTLENRVSDMRKDDA